VKLATCIALALALALACGGGARTAPDDASPPPADAAEAWKVVSTERGKAAWYGGRFHGRKTASGEPFDKNALTAAHKKLPFDTMVRVRNLDNGRTVIVRITDRGPYGKGRIIDLAEAAAEELDMIDAGVVDVEVEVLERRE
jgi:rare lipoprotein A